MQNAIHKEIVRIAQRQLRDIQSDEDTWLEFAEKFQRRTGLPYAKPKAGSKAVLHKHFDAEYCKKHAKFLAKGIWSSILNGRYQPLPAVNFSIPKPNGGTRSLMQFAIPDSAVANVFMRRLRDRNIKRFSPHSFAYHPQLNIFDAIIDTRKYIASSDKIFSVQVDFTDYFESIRHKYFTELLTNRELFSITDAERDVVWSFLKHQFAMRLQYSKALFDRRQRGTPQGSSLSLILANLANHNLDLSLERQGGKFVRFAEDVTALCENYDDAVEIEKQFYKHCSGTGININFKKSPGINLLSKNTPENSIDHEIRSVHNIDYLGYRFTKDSLTLSDKTITRIKRKISKLCSIYLIQYGRQFSFGPGRVGKSPNFDWDLLGLISELRNYMYGGLSESNIRSMLSGGNKFRKMNGLMSFYALLEDHKVLADLDGWLVNTVRRAHSHRVSLMIRKGHPVPARVNNGSLISGKWMDADAWDGTPVPEFELPSFVRGWRSARKYYYTFGLKDVRPPAYGYDY